MHLETYKIEHSEDFLSFTFYSIGPKGTIKKSVEFTLIPSFVYDCYNLGFGDADEYGEISNDMIITNNKDTEKVLVSVAQIAIMFTEQFPDAFILVEANTESKMRLYQMKINKYWDEIYMIFELYGSIDGLEFIPYEPGNKCLLIVGRRKIK